MIDEIPGNVLWQEDLLYEDSDLITITNTIDDNNVDRSFYVPLRFFFMHHTSTAIPVSKMAYQNAEILVYLADFHDCCPESVQHIPELSIELKLNSHFFDQLERQHLFKNDWTNTIHQHKYYEYDINPSDTNSSIWLDMKGSIELIAFTLHTDKNDLYWCGYNSENNDPLISASFNVNNVEMFQHDAQYLRIFDKKESTLNIPYTPIYTYSFGLFLKESMYNGQTSGTLNCSVLNNISLNLKVKKGVERICLWTINKNTLSIKNGAHLVLQNS